MKNIPPPPPWTIQGFNTEGKPCDIVSFGWTQEKPCKLVLCSIDPTLAALIVDAVNYWNEEFKPQKVDDICCTESSGSDDHIIRSCSAALRDELFPGLIACLRNIYEEEQRVLSKTGGDFSPHFKSLMTQAEEILKRASDA